MDKDIQSTVTVRLSVKAGQIISATGTGPEALATSTAQWVREHWKFSKDVTGSFTVPIYFEWHPKKVLKK